MKDSLKQFIERHREEFDTRTPSSAAWGRVAGALGFKQSPWWNNVVIWRAAAIVMMGVSVYLYAIRPSTDQKVTVAQQEFGDIELFYSAQISEKVALITNEGDPADDSYTQDLQKLEAMYTVLYDELKRHPSEKVKDALVLNMLVRIDLLNQQIQKLEESKRRKDDMPSSI